MCDCTRRAKSTRVRSIGVLALVTLVGCAGSLRDGVFSKSGVRYRVGLPDDTNWRRVGFAENDLAWVSRATGHVISTNATCRNHGDPSLEVLTQHLLFGFGDRQQKSQTVEEIDGREALHTKYDVTIDGVPAEIELVVLKKNDCVHDFSYISPPGQSGVYQTTFDRLIAGFAQEQSP